MRDELLSATREALRTAIIAGVPLVIVQLQAGSFEMVSVYIAIAIGLLKGAESWAHKENKGNIVSKTLEFGYIE